MVSPLLLNRIKIMSNSTECVRCGAEIIIKSIAKCPECIKDLRDIEYLDSGSEAQIREKCDRGGAISADYFEGERDSVNLLEDDEDDN